MDVMALLVCQLEHMAGVVWSDSIVVSHSSDTLRQRKLSK